MTICIPIDSAYSSAFFERKVSNARNGIRDGDGGKAGTIPERIVRNARDGIRDANRGKAGTRIERLVFNARNRIRDGDRGKAGTTIKRHVSNARDGIRDVDRGKAGTTIERRASNARDGIRDVSIHASRYQCVCTRLNNGIAFISTVIVWISFFYCYRTKTRTTAERIDSNARNGIRDGD